MILLLLVSLVALASARVDFCAEHKFPASETTSKLQFTKELTEFEYADDTKFKSLHCCAKGYRSIEWFKDGLAYPWAGANSGFILYPESANQTIYTLGVKLSDAGRYTCRVRNDSRTIEHSTQLTVFDKGGYMEKPLWTHKPDPISEAVLGGQARLFCEAFVGYIDLPDAKNEVIWEKMGNISFLINNPRIHIKQAQRESGEVVGAYLLIDDVQWSDFGTYTCTISNTGDQSISMDTLLQALSEDLIPMCLWSKATMIVSLGVLLVISCLASCAVKYLTKKNQKLSTIVNKLARKSPFHSDKTLKKTGGLVLVYKSEDTEFVEKTLIPALIEKSPYNVFPHHLTNDGCLTAEAKDMINKVGRQVVVFTPNVVKSWTQPLVIGALHNLVLAQHHSILLIEPLPKNNGDCSFDFDSLVKRYKIIGWPESGDTLEAKTVALVESLAAPAVAEPVNSYRPPKASLLAKMRASRVPEAHV